GMAPHPASGRHGRGVLELASPRWHALPGGLRTPAARVWPGLHQRLRTLRRRRPHAPLVRPPPARHGPLSALAAAGPGIPARTPAVFLVRAAPRPPAARADDGRPGRAVRRHRAGRPGRFRLRHADLPRRPGLRCASPPFPTSTATCPRWTLYWRTSPAGA